MVELVRARLGTSGTVVGDRPDTDGALARRLGYRFVLVLSGSTIDPEGADPAPDVVAADLRAAVAELLA
jgi:ribonucleotide monophosphatase NagD (HAD superfamily)